MCMDLCVYGCAAVMCWMVICVLLCLWMPKVGLTLVALVVSYALYVVLRSCCSVEVHAADTGAETLYAKQHGKTPDLPEKFQGVFWFDGNPAPELLMTFEGQYFDPERRKINLNSGGTYSWSMSNDTIGWAYWCCLRASWATCSELNFNFNEDYTYADMPLYVGGCNPDSCSCDGCWVPMGQWWSMDQIDEDTWNRNITLYCWPCSRWEFGSYFLKRVIRADGTRTPYFDEMMQMLEEHEPVKGLLRKPTSQIMNGDDWKGHLCFGEQGNPDIETGSSEPVE